MSVAFPTSPPISQSSSVSTTFRILSAKFGNGAEQTAPDGSNQKIETWTINFENLGSSDYTTIVTNFLETLTGSESITWNGKYYKLVTDSNAGFTVQTLAGSIYTVQFQLRQIFQA